jgi:atypical dual specificity phosphatase
LYLPTVDHLEPTVEDMRKAVHFIEQHVQQGRKVLIHCMAGTSCVQSSNPLG